MSNKINFLTKIWFVNWINGKFNLLRGRPISKKEVYRIGDISYFWTTPRSLLVQYHVNNSNLFIVKYYLFMFF